MALGGQGAPLAPGFHELVWRHPTRTRVVLNCGGIANISVLKPGRPCIGFDTGPANILMDAWIEACQGLRYDRDGAWAAQGQLHPVLLQALLADPYFALPAPKSTGREHFKLAWLQQRLAALPGPPPLDADVQRCLLELSVRSIAHAVDAVNAVHSPADSGDLLVCGGGAFNPRLMQRLAGAKHSRPRRAARLCGSAGFCRLCAAHDARPKCQLAASDRSLAGMCSGWHLWALKPLL
jgi:anhydro-N-acetylmuramic acid kinase